MQLDRGKTRLRALALIALAAFFAGLTADGRYRPLPRLSAAARAESIAGDPEAETLSGDQPTYRVPDGQVINRLTIEPGPAGRTRGMVLTLSDAVLMPGTYLNGRLDADGNYLEEEGSRTTDWFPVDPRGGSLLLTGNFNCAIFAFELSDGTISAFKDDRSFNDTRVTRFNSQTFSTAAIPADARRCRVCYRQGTSDVALPGDRILLYYGAVPQGVGGSGGQTVLDIPDLGTGDRLEYADGVFTLIRDGEGRRLDWTDEAVTGCAQLAVTGDTPGTVRVWTAPAANKGRAAQYGIRYAVKDGLSAGERLGDARRLSFDFRIGKAWANGGGSGFDTAYPWSMMRLCCVSGQADGRLTLYEGDPGFKTDGSAGDVMVEIPLFYVRRIKDAGTEELWITGEPREGYLPAPVFTQGGKLRERVYVSAYNGALKNGALVSASGLYPAVNVPYGELLRAADAGQNGGTEIDYWMISALTCLFSVEAGTLDASSLFPGESALLYFTPGDDRTQRSYIARSDTDSDTILVYSCGVSKQITVGSSLIILPGAWAGLTDENAVRAEVKRRTVGENTIELKLDRKVTVVRDTDAVSNIASRTGKTDGLGYHTGNLSAKTGTVGFKYRGVENLYGSICLMLNRNVWLNDGHVYLNVDGRIVRLNERLPEQRESLKDFAALYANGVREMIYNEDYPLLMLPEKIGGPVYAYYGDYWYNVYDALDRYLVYGGAHDNKRLAGLYQFRAWLQSSTRLPFYGGRLMLLP